MKFSAILLCVTCICASSLYAQYNPTEAVPAAWKTGIDSITEEDSKRLLEILHGFDGRGTGQTGYVKAAYFVAGKLAEYGFEPIGDNGTYFQNLPFARVGPNLEASSVTIGDQTLRPKDGIGFVSFMQNQQVKSTVAFIKAKGERLTLTDAKQFKDKIVVLNAENTGISFLRPLFQDRPKCVLQVVDGTPENRTRVVRGGGSGGGGGPLRLQITRDVARKIAAKCAVEEDIVLMPEDSGTSSAITDVEMSIDLRLIDQPIKVPNVVGWLEGSDPELNDEYIVVGAHLDHLGTRDGKVFPGADDNGSGSAAILQIARALHENPNRPGRSVLYIAFSAEEIGLVGSKYYVEHPLKPLEKCLCMLNIDMIGRNEETANDKAEDNTSTIHLIGVKKQTPSLHATVLEANKHVGFTFEYDEERVNGRSDQAPFFKKDIPITFLFGGFNPYYHKTTDGLEGINYSKIANAARLNYLCVFLADEHGKYEIGK